MGRKDTQPARSEQEQSRRCQTRILAEVLGAAIDTAKTATKMGFVAPPPWGPGGHEEGRRERDTIIELKLDGSAMDIPP